MGTRTRCTLDEEAYWRGQFAVQQRSGLTVPQFCREHDLSEPRFRRWKSKLLRRRREQGHGGHYAAETSATNAVAAPSVGEAARSGSRRKRESGCTQAGTSPRRAAGREDAGAGEPGGALFAEVRLAADGVPAAQSEFSSPPQAAAGEALLVELRLGERADRPTADVATINVAEDLPLVLALPNGRQLHLGDGARTGCGAAGESSSRTDSPIEVLLAGNRRVLVQPGFDAPTLARLLAVLERRPC